MSIEELTKLLDDFGTLLSEAVGGVDYSRNLYNHLLGVLIALKTTLHALENDDNED